MKEFESKVLGIKVDISDSDLKERLMNINAIEFGERSIEDIINRLNVKSENIISSEKGVEIVRVIRSFLNINCELEQLPNLISDFAKKENKHQFDNVIETASNFSKKIKLGIGNTNSPSIYLHIKPLPFGFPNEGND